jgi:uncharacterized protein YeeX (DUF496 family)
MNNGVLQYQICNMQFYSLVCEISGSARVCRKWYKKVKSNKKLIKLLLYLYNYVHDRLNKNKGATCDISKSML